MALDYSKLTDEELDAIARDDYSKLSDKTLRAISSDSAAKKPAPKTETAAQTFGRSAASLADTALNAITGTLDVAAYPFARAYYGTVGGLSPEAAAARATAETTSPKDVVGRAFGVTGTTGYEQAPLRQLGTWAGQTVGENVIQPTAQTFNIPESDVGNMLNSLAMGVAPVAGRVTAPVGRAVGQGIYAVDQAVASPVQTAKTVGRAVAAVPDVARGFTGTLSGKIAKPGTEPIPYRQVPSVMEPAGTAHIPADVMAEYQAGRITPEQARAAEIPYTRAQQQALERTGGMVPYSGDVARATGAILADPYTRFSGYLPAGPFGAVGLPALNLVRKGVGAYQAAKTASAANELGNLKFTPLTAEQRVALANANLPPNNPPSSGMGGGGGFPSTPPLPLLPYTPAGESPIPMGGPGRRVNIEGESYNLPYDINTSNAQTARPQSTIGPTAEQLAAQQAAERARISEANKLRVAQQLEEQRNAAQPVQAEVTAPVAPTPEITAPVVEVPTAPKQQRPMTAAEIRRKLPFIPGESEAAFEARVQAVLKARPMVDVAPPPAPKETGKRSYVRQEDRIREAEAKLTAEERAAQEAEVERQLAKSRGKTVSGPVAPKETVSTESLKAKMSTPEQTAMDEATRARLEQLGLLGKKKTPPKDTMGMMTESQIAFKQQEMVDKLGNRPTYGDYIDAQGNKIVYSERYPGVSDEVKARLSDADQPIIQKFNPQGERIPMGEDWSATDPAPRKVLVEKRLGKEPYEVIWDQNGDVIKESGRLNKPFKHDKSITITRVQEYLNPMEGEGGIIFEATGRSKAGEDVRIVQYNDGQLIGIFEKNGKDRVVKYK
jgi:hypothetical protein